MAHMVYIKQMWERRRGINPVVGSDSLDSGPPKHNSCCVCTSNFTCFKHTHTSRDEFFVFSGTLSGASVHRASVLRFKYDGVVSPGAIIEGLSTDEFSGLLVKHSCSS